MCENERVNGPALLVAKDTTIVIPTDYSAKMANGGYLIITPND
jgi:N-methylhydantoinase A/oxoprolinase/acetone carboxylase beta subunit